LLVRVSEKFVSWGLRKWWGEDDKRHDMRGKRRRL
jgi:hypothetical protein